MKLKKKPNNALKTGRNKMTFEQLWNAMVKKNPSLANLDAKVTISAMQFKMALEQAYAKGKDSNPIDEFNDLFKGTK